MMSVIVYYVHVTAEQMEHLRRSRDSLWQVGEDAKFEGAELYDMDKDWQVIPWLLSEKRREEQKWEFALMAATLRRDVNEKEPGAFERVEEEERKRLGVMTSREVTNKMPDDVVLTAIEGRGPADQCDETITLGLGPARVFPPDAVRILSNRLGELGPDDLRQHFDRVEMARWDVGGMGWLEEDDSVLELLIAAFARLQAFYRRATELGHYVLIIYG